jgi:hypothetical protein
VDAAASAKFKVPNPGRLRLGAESRKPHRLSARRQRLRYV